MNLDRIRQLAGINLNEKSTSEKQARFMAAAAHDPKFAKRVGIDQDVAKEFNKADTGTKLLSKAMKKESLTLENSQLSMINRIIGELDNYKAQGYNEIDAYEKIGANLSNEGYTISEIDNFFHEVDQVLSNQGNEDPFLDDNDVDMDDSMDGDHDSAMASAGHGTDEDYGYFGGDDDIYEMDDIEEDLDNGYNDVHDASSNDYFPSGADSPVVRTVGPSGARHGDNPEQKRMQIAEIHEELLSGYKTFLEEMDTKKKN